MVAELNPWLQPHEKYLNDFRDRNPVTFTDPVFGELRLGLEERRAKRMLDTFELNRLHNIRQAGVQYLVRPSATHSRFAHAIGSTALLAYAIEVVKRKAEQRFEIPDGYWAKAKDMLVLSMLLHDIGHAPYSHVLEKQLDGVTHEGIAKELIRGHGAHFDEYAKYYEENVKKHHPDEKFPMIHQEIRALLTPQEIDLLCMIISGQRQGARTPEEAFCLDLAELIEGPLDIDRIDHLHRDMLYCGYRDASYDPFRILEFITLEPSPHVAGGFSLAIEEAAVLTAIMMLFSREMIKRNIWLDPNVLGYEVIINECLKNHKPELPNWFVLNDQELLAKLLQMASAGETINISRIMNRTQMFECLYDIAGDKAKLLIENKASIKSAVQNELQLGEHQVFVFERTDHSDRFLRLQVAREGNGKGKTTQLLMKYLQEKNEYQKIVDWIMDSDRRNTLFRIYGPANVTKEAKQKIKAIADGST